MPATPSDVDILRYILKKYFDVTVIAYREHRKDINQLPVNQEETYCYSYFFNTMHFNAILRL